MQGKKRAKGRNSTCSDACFVPKPFYAFQVGGPDSLAVLRENQAHLPHRVLKIGASPSTARSGGVLLERGLAEAMMAVRCALPCMEVGCILVAGREHFHFELWVQAF
jgi:hypothetical protein